MRLEPAAAGAESEPEPLGDGGGQETRGEKDYFHIILPFIIIVLVNVIIELFFA